MKALIDGDGELKPPSYYVTMCGKVFSKERKHFLHNRHKTPYVRTYKEKQLKTRINDLGYEQVPLYIEGKHKTVLVHRLVANTFLPNPNNLPEVNHKDGIKSNNKVNNLEWVDRKGNCNHAIQILGKGKGELSGTSKLTNYQVLEIKNLLDKQVSLTEIAKIHNVTIHAIFRIRHGYNWSWLTGYEKKGGCPCPTIKSVH